jgi:acyl-CoA synthetase (AMP-forming)/AMP-acid ligase II
MVLRAEIGSVFICTKSPAAIAAIFGIMKTRACYVPVHANAPGPRLEEIGRQCAFRALITSHGLYQKLSDSFHHECSMNAIYFIDKAPEAALPLPALTFAGNLPQQSQRGPCRPGDR